MDRKLEKPIHFLVRTNLATRGMIDCLRMNVFRRSKKKPSDVEINHFFCVLLLPLWLYWSASGLNRRRRQVAHCRVLGRGTNQKAEQIYNEIRAFSCDTREIGGGDVRSVDGKMKLC